MGTVATPGTMRSIMSADQFLSFEVCGRCYELRGPFDYRWKGTQYRFVQECRCARDARPAGERPPLWISFDFNTAAELCYGCGGRLLRSGSRFSVWFCGECKRRAIECNRAVGKAAIPIGRHSLMHGFALSPDSAGSPEIGAFVNRMGSLIERMNLVCAWSHEVVHHNLVDTGLDRRASIDVSTYLEALTGLDREGRFAMMLEWFMTRPELG